MQKVSIAAVLCGLVAVPFVGALSQDTNEAFAPNPRSEYVVFLDNGSSRLSPAAIETVREAARAARSSRTIELEGRADYAKAVKAELVRQGAPADAISIRPTVGQSLQKVGASDPIDRRVEIKF